MNITETSYDKLGGNDQKRVRQLMLMADPCEGMVATYIHQVTLLCTRTEDGILTGVAGLLRISGDSLEIKTIAVAPAYRGAGIGKALIGRAKEKATKLGLPTLFIGTGNSSLSQMALYQRQGFRFERIIRDFFARAPYTKVIEEDGIRCRDLIYFKLDV